MASLSASPVPIWACDVWRGDRPLSVSSINALRSRDRGPSEPGRGRYTAAVAFALAFLLYCVHRRSRPADAEPVPVHGYPLFSADLQCADQEVGACALSAADLDKRPDELFRLHLPDETVEVGEPLVVEIVASAEQGAACLLRSSVFVVELSGPRIQRAQLVGTGSVNSLRYAADISEPGEYRVQAFLRLFNYPFAVCDSYTERADGRYIDRVVVDGNTTVLVQPGTSAGLPLRPSRTCEYGDLYDMRGTWLEAPVPATTKGAYEKQHRCALAELPTPAEAYVRARAAGIRWLRFVGDSNTRYLYEGFPLVDPIGTALQYMRKVPPYDLRSSCGSVFDPPSARQRNPRATREFCRVGLATGDPQDDILVSWEWFTPIHPPSLAAYFNDEENDYWTNATLGSLLAPREDDPRNNRAPITSILSDRPDLLALRGGDRTYLSYGSHATTHTRDDVAPYIDEIVAAAERLATLENADPSSPQKRLSFALTTAKSCRKFRNATEITADMFRTCHSENFRDKNLAILRAFAARGLAGPNGESVPARDGSPRVPLDVLDFWHTTEALEDVMTDKVHFGPGVYFLHSRAVATTVFAGEVPS